MAVPMPMTAPASASRKSSPGYKPHQFAPLRSKGHANTQLAGTPRHFVRGIFNSWRNYDSIL
jgi:hypothetical protein